MTEGYCAGFDFTELIDIFTLSVTLPNRGVVLTEAGFVIVTSLFALELAAPLMVLMGLILKESALVILKASALPHARLNAVRALRRPTAPGVSKPVILARARNPVAVAPVAPAADETSYQDESRSDADSIEALARAIDEAQSWQLKSQPGPIRAR